MNKHLFLISLLVAAAIAVHAEIRTDEAFYPPEKLKEMSSLVFTGKVLEVETIEKYRVTFPIKAKVDKVLKGELKEEELTFPHKNPGMFNIIEKEFKAPEIGQEGTFYLQAHNGTLILIGYIKKTVPPAEEAALKLGRREVLSVNDATALLETSLNKEERTNALCDLRAAEAEAEPARFVLGRIIATGPCDDEAGYAVETLGYIGRPGIPVIASLAANGFEHAWLCARAIKRFPNARELELNFVTALEPMLKSPLGSLRFGALLLLREFPLSTETANRMTRFQFDDRLGLKSATALFIAFKANDPTILAAIEKQPGESMKFLAAKLREEWRIRDCPIHRHQKMLHVPRPLPAEEQERDKNGAEEVSRLARNAIPEALANLRCANRDDQQYLWMQMLAAIARHTELPQTETLDALKEVHRRRGSRMDLLLDEWHRGLSAKHGS